MMKWFGTVSLFVEEAAKKADLRPCLPGFDGDGWVWIWRVEPTKERTSEARLRIRPHSTKDGAQLEVSAAAWMEKRREIATNQVVWSQFFSATDLEQHSKISPVLVEHLREGRIAALDLGQHLVNLERGRERVISDLRNRKLLES